MCRGSAEKETILCRTDISHLQIEWYIVGGHHLYQKILNGVVVSISFNKYNSPLQFGLKDRKSNCQNISITNKIIFKTLREKIEESNNQNVILSKEKINLHIILLRMYWKEFISMIEHRGMPGYGTTFATKSSLEDWGIGEVRAVGMKYNRHYSVLDRRSSVEMLRHYATSSKMEKLLYKKYQ